MTVIRHRQSWHIYCIPYIHCTIPTDFIPTDAVLTDFVSNITNPNPIPKTLAYPYCLSE